MQNDFQITVEDRDGLIFSDKVVYLSSRNEAGKFDILPGHANFITLIKGNIEIHLLDDSVREIPADNAVLKFEDNQCQIYMGIKQEG